MNERRLCAAAPDMLALLKLIDRGIKKGAIKDASLLLRRDGDIELEAMSDRIRAVIAMATGVTT